MQIHLENIYIYNLLISQTYPNVNDNKFTITYDIKTNKYTFNHLHYEFDFMEHPIVLSY